MDLCFAGDTDVRLKDAIPFQWGGADVLFAFDQSGSMASTIEGAQADATELMRVISARLGTQRFGVAGFSDYVDFPYRLYQPLTGDHASVQSAIDGLTLADGGDIPEAYGRLMYESYADPGVGWDPESQKVLVIFGDSYPHDPDAGRDGIAGTGDDLVLADVLERMRAEDITLIYVADPGISAETSLIDQWRAWTDATAGTTIRCTGP